MERIAEGTVSLSDWHSFEELSRPTSLNCPDRRSALFEIDGGRLPRFRCRSGHAFSALSLLDGQAEAPEDLQSAVFGALLEEATLARRLLRAGEDPALLRHLRERADWLEATAAKLADWLETPGVGDRGT